MRSIERFLTVAYNKYMKGRPQCHVTIYVSPAVYAFYHNGLKAITRFSDKDLKADDKPKRLMFKTASLYKDDRLEGITIKIVGEYGTLVESMDL